MSWKVGDIVKYRYNKDLVRCVVLAELNWMARVKFYRIEICDKSWSGIAVEYQLHPENQPAPPGAQLTMF